jgi:hypothetical protein
MGQSIDPPGAATTTGAMTGGTGVYANARRTFVSRHTNTGSDDTISLAALGGYRSLLAVSTRR